VTTAPLGVQPATSEVIVTHENQTGSSLTFSVDSEAVPDETVEYTYFDVSNNDEYVLYSETAGVARGQGIASSFVTISDDDSTERLVFRQEGDAAVSSGGSGGGGGAGIIAEPSPGLPAQIVPVALVGAVLAGLVVVSRGDDEVSRAGESAASTVQSGFERAPIVGPAVAGAVSGAVKSANELARAALKNQTVTISLVVGAGLVAGQLGIIPLPEESLIIGTVVTSGIVGVVALREFGEFTTARWVALVIAATVVALQSLSSEGLLTAIVESQVWPILAIGALYLAYLFVQGIQQPNNVTEIVVGGDDGGDN